MKIEGIEMLEEINSLDIKSAEHDPKNLLSPPILFNNKSFNNKVFLSYEMATYWDLSIGLMHENFYKVVCNDNRFNNELDELTQNNQYDVALLKFLHFLNPLIANTLKNIIDEDMNSVSTDSLSSKGKLKYRGGELIPSSIYSQESYVVKSFPQEGSKVYTQNNSIIIIGQYLGDGGEGIVYKSSKKNEVVKLIKLDNHGRINESVKKRLEQMVKMKISNPNIIWPLETVYNEDGQFVGFTMKYIQGIDLKHFTSSIVKNVNDNSDEININDIDKKSLCKIIISILDTIIYLHDRNIIIGDIKLENFMIKDNDITNIYFIDCDSYQLGNYPSLLVSPGFVPPEIDPINLGKQNSRFRTFGNEYYAIFSLLFHLVFRAKPPYSQQIHDDSYVSETARVTKGLFPYFLDQEKTLIHAPKGMEEPIWAHLPSYVKKAFINCGNRNGMNFGEENRLNPKQWRHIFVSYLDDLNGTDLILRDPLCNNYHYGLDDTIAYELVDYSIPTDGITKRGLSMEETIVQRFRNNDYVKNMILTKLINVQDFGYTMFNQKLYNNKVLLSLELIKNWKLSLDFLREEPLGAFGLNPTDFAKITNNKAKRKYNLALFNFIKSLNNDIFIAYDGMNFNTLSDYGKYLNDYYYFQDKVIIPYDILEDAIDNDDILQTLKSIYSKKAIDNNDLDVIINLLCEDGIYSSGVCYETLEDYLVSIFLDELNIKQDNLFTNDGLCNIIMKKFKIPTHYDFTRKQGYYELTYKLLSYVPFKYKGYMFKCMEDIVEYSKSPTISYNEKFVNIGRWINTGTLKQYSSIYPIMHKVGEEIDVFKMVSDNKLQDWEAGHLFYLANVRFPAYVTKNNVVFSNLKELMETLTKINDIESFTNMLYSNCLFDLWCEMHKKPIYKLAY